MSASERDVEWERFKARVRSITHRDKDGRLKLRGLSKSSVPQLMYIHNQLTGLSRLTRKELLADIERICNETDEELFIEEMSAKDGNLDVRLKANPALIAVLAEQMAATLEEQGGANYVEWRFRSASANKGFTLLVQRDNGKTPAQRFNALKTDLQAVIDTWGTTTPRNTISKPKAAKVLGVILEEHK